jgi:CRISPR/Cas system-associated exonuclease Cas4 (RecB family)
VTNYSKVKSTGTENMWEVLAKNMVLLLRQIVSNDSRVTGLVILIILSIIVIDLLLQRIKETAKTTGIKLTQKKTQAVGIEGTKQKPVKNYISTSQGLAGKPDAVLIEDGSIIPVEHKPLANKLRDRYVAQLLVYMRLIEEIDGKRPPYGYLILGANARRVKVSNTRQRQEWLDLKLIEMRGILDGQPAIADPHPNKCHSCRVRNECSFRAESG